MHNDYMKPYQNFRVITIASHNDTTAIPEGVVRGIKLDGSESKSNVALRSRDNGSVTIVGLANNVIHPISTDQIFQTGTTATTVTVFW
jgi:hypothetical protein